MVPVGANGSRTETNGRPRPVSLSVEEELAVRDVERGKVNQGGLRVSSLSTYHVQCRDGGTLDEAQVYICSGTVAAQMNTLFKCTACPVSSLALPLLGLTHQRLPTVCAISM